MAKFGSSGRTEQTSRRNLCKPSSRPVGTGCGWGVSGPSSCPLAPHPAWALRGCASAAQKVAALLHPPIVLHVAQVGGSPCFTQALSCPHSHPREGVKLREERAGRTDLPSLGGCENLYLATAIPLHPTEEQQIHLPWNERTNMFFQAPGPTVSSCNLLRAHFLLKDCLLLDPCHIVGSLGCLPLLTLSLQGGDGNRRELLP